MKANITYLFGAGASGLTMPVVSQISGAIDELKRNLIGNFSLNHSSYNKVSMMQLKDALVSDLEWLQSENSRSSSIDTFAKELYLRNDDNFLKVKSLLSLVLQYQQFLKGNDKRYVNLLTRIMDGSRNEKIKLPSTVKFVSWNYDTQFESAFHHITGERFYQSNLIQNYMCSPESCNVDNPIFLKLNGSINHYYAKDNEYTHPEYPEHLIQFAFRGIPIGSDGKYSSMEQNQVLSDILEQYYDYSDYRGRYFNGLPSIHYAWENTEYAKKVRKLALLSTKGTNELVVIGYSFPDFNRKIDREILNNMSRLIRITIQDLDPDSIERNLEELLSSRNKCRIDKIRINYESRNNSTFFLPPKFE